MEEAARSGRSCGYSVAQKSQRGVTLQQRRLENKDQASSKDDTPLVISLDTKDRAPVSNSPNGTKQLVTRRPIDQETKIRH